MRIVVTGASGFLAPFVIGKLKSMGGDVVAVSRSRGSGFSSVSSYGDTPDGDVLVHLAQDNDRARVNTQPSSYAENAVAEMETLASRYARVIYASSASLYGDRGLSPRKEDDPVIAGDTYARIKIGCEEVVLAHGCGVAVRLANLFGPGQSENTVLSTILGQVSKSGPLVVRDDTPVRDFLWVEDAADCLVQMATGAPTGIFNVGSGIGTSVRELALQALDVLGQSDRAVVAGASGGRLSVLGPGIPRPGRCIGSLRRTAG